MQTEKPAATSDSEEAPKKETVLLVWLSFLILGGGLLALYYARIGYLPDIEWHLSLVYLAVVSFIGGAFGLLQSLAIFLPGYIWSEALIRDSQITEAFCHEEDTSERSVYWIFLHLGIPFLICLIVSHVVLALPLGIYLYVPATALSIAVVSYFFIWRKFPNLPLPKGKKVDSPRKCKYVFWFGLSVLLNQIAVLLIYYISQPKGWDYWAITCICIFVVLVSNHVIAVRHSKSARQARAASLAASLLLLVAADQFMHLPEKIMSLYGFGGENSVTILVNEDGANLIERLDLLNADCGARHNVCGAQILSAVGPEYLIRLGDTTFTLPKSMVISRSRTAAHNTPGDGAVRAAARQ